jgi:glycosyltransferase involved in cell wall biosynthesis
MAATSEHVWGHVLESVSVVLPAHNEEDNIVQAVHEALAAAEPVSERQEVIVVDDGSSDATAALATSLAARDSRVRLVQHERNRGYGSAVRSGIAAARMDWVLLTDADLQFDLTQLSAFAAHTVEAPLVIGYRANRSDPLIRRINARGWNGLVHVLFQLDVRDVDAAFKLIRRSALDGIELVATGAAVDAELLAKATGGGAELIELPVRHRPRISGTPSGANLRVIGRAFREVFQIWWSMNAPRPRPRPLPSAFRSPAG